MNTNFNALGSLGSASKRHGRNASDNKDNPDISHLVSPSNSRSDNVTPQAVLGNQSHGAIVEIVEEALKWRIQAQDRKVAERMSVLEDKISQNKESIQKIETLGHTDLNELKNQLIDVSSEVLLQV